MRRVLGDADENGAVVRFHRAGDPGRQDREHANQHRRLIDDVARQELLDDVGCPLLEQLTLARFVEAAGLTRHLRRVRGIYRRRRDATIEAVAASLPGAVPTGVAAGLHVYIQLPQWCDESRLIEAARRRGVLVEGASWHWSRPESAPPSLVLGYGSIDEPAIRDGLEMVGSIYRDGRSR
jgi:GntR family transcriptional regulator/MocR family aminotransferase